MKIKVNPTQLDSVKVVYPCLMYNTKLDNLLVLMIGDRADHYGRGVCLVTKHASNVVGEYSENWYLPNFRPFKGVITLEN